MRKLLETNSGPPRLDDRRTRDRRNWRRITLLLSSCPPWIDHTTLGGTEKRKIVVRPLQKSNAGEKCDMTTKSDRPWRATMARQRISPGAYRSARAELR